MRVQIPSLQVAEHMLDWRHPEVVGAQEHHFHLQPLEHLADLFASVVAGVVEDEDTGLPPVWPSSVKVRGELH